MIYDLIIIGAGPAGISAAIYAKRAGLNVLCLDKSMIGGYLNYVDRIDNYPGLFGISGPDFAFKLYEHMKALDIPFKNKEVISIVDGDVKKVLTSNEEYMCKNVIIATGRSPRELGLNEENKLIGKGLSHCALCDGAFYKDKIVAVVGGGNSALQEALHLATLCKKVFIIHRRNEFRAVGQVVDKVTNTSNISIIMNANVVDYELLEGKLNKIHLDNGDVLEVSGIFIYIGFVPNTKFAIDLNITNKNGYIEVDNNFETRIKGIYAIGDIIEKDIYQICTGVAEGAIVVTKITENSK